MMCNMFTGIYFRSKYKKYTIMALALIVLLIIVCFGGYLVYSLHWADDSLPVQRYRRERYKSYRRIKRESFMDSIVNPDENNLFMYWVGPVPEFIMYLRKLIYLHSQNQTKYKIHLINRENVKTYIDEIPECFDKLKPAHQADYVRVAAVCKYGGIWLDSDTIVMNDLSSMFAKLKDHDGFFVTEDDGLFNGVFGSKANTPLMVDWLSKIKDVLRAKKETINWTDIGSGIINDYKNKAKYKSLITGYYIYDGPNSIYPINWNQINNMFVEESTESTQYMKEDQPVIILFWSSGIKQKLEVMSIDDFFDTKRPIGAFLNKSMITINIDYNKLKEWQIPTH